MIIQLIDYNREMVAAWEKAFSGVSDITIQQNSAFAVFTKCICSPANGHCDMTGGFDLTIVNNLGQTCHANAKKKVREEYNGELLVGQAMWVPTENPIIPYMISAPTMRCAQWLGPKSVNAYLAARAIFLLLKQPNLPFSVVTIPGLGTGVGKVPYHIAAHQMRAAYEEFYLGKYVFPENWKVAQEHQQYLCKIPQSQMTDLQFESNNVNVVSDDDLKDMFDGPTQF